MAPLPRADLPFGHRADCRSLTSGRGTARFVRISTRPTCGLTSGAQRRGARRVGVPRFSNIWTIGGYWPEDLEWLRVQAPTMAFAGGNYVTPHTILVRGNTILERRFTVNGWLNFVQPRLMRELASA